MRRRWLVRAALAAAGLAAALAASEIFIRVANPLGVSHFRDSIRYNTELLEIVGPPRILKHKPNQTLELSDFSIRTNGLGLRGAEIPEPKPAGETRIFSWGFGLVGMGRPRGRPLHHAGGARAERAGPAGRAIRCVNGGHNLFDTTQEAGLLEELGDRVQPDAVIPRLCGKRRRADPPAL